MPDIGDFVQRVSEEFQEIQQSYVDSEGSSLGRFNLGLSPAAVGGLVRAVYYASTIPDEGRFPTGWLMSYREGDSREFHIPFCPPREPTAQEIAKLVHAAALGSHLCIVCEDGKPLLAGIHVTMLDELRQFGYSSFRVGNPLRFVIRGPGHVEVSTGGISLIFRAGEILEDKPLQHADVMHALGTALAEGFEGHTTGAIESLEDVFNDLAEAIVRLGHGGLLLFVRNPDLAQFSSAQPTDGRLLRQLLIRYWNDVATLLQAAGGNAILHDDALRQAVGPHSLTVSTDTAMLENCISAIGHLSGMDGAIVMDYSCNVVAFNAIISRDAEDTPPAQLVDAIDRPLDPAELGRNRGSRHQSAMSFARRVSQSFAFVISQDGGVTAFHNRGDGTVRWEGGLRVLD